MGFGLFSSSILSQKGSYRTGGFVDQEGHEQAGVHDAPEDLRKAGR